MRYTGLWLGLFVFSAGATCVLGPNVLSVLVFPVPLAVYAARGEWPKAFGLLGCAVVAAGLGISGFGALTYAAGVLAKELVTFSQMAGIALRTILIYALLAGSGLLIGFGIGRGWTYGKVVSLTSGAVFGVVGVYMVLNWQELNTQLDALFDYFVQSIQTTAPAEQADTVEEQVEAMTYLKAQKSGLIVGFQFAAILLTTCIFVSLTSGALRRWFGEPGPIGSFKDMRPPDWMVWFVIATAVLWLIDYQYGAEQFRFVSWNMATALFAVYMLNGFAIFLYGVNALSPGFLLMALIVFIFINFGLPVLGAIGLFDTWAAFRQRIDRL
ncbi:MAG TPA: DUF2232 domain-containing protein, partial [Candidatus Hydrogenedentes bacterium]|nr:DUF2232 domain-containing protein [Candidatus Hydrogenedentota bacterium]